MSNSQMPGALVVEGATLRNAGFMPPSLNAQVAPQSVPSSPLFTRGTVELSDDTKNYMASIKRGEVVGDINQVVSQFGISIADLQRAISSQTSAFPVRENLEAEASLLVPVDTPLRNRLPRIQGAGLASAWRQITSLGGVSLQTFFRENGAPADHSTVYAAKSAAYKLLGTYGSVTGFAMAAGASFQNQLTAEKTNQMKNLMLNEENALINGDSTATAAPWGDGTNALGFDGLVKLISTANGTPTAQVQAAVGALTTTHIDAQLTRLWNQGGQGLWMLLAAQEIQSMTHLAEANGSIIRVSASSDGKAVFGIKVTGYVHPVSGEIVDLMPSRYQTAGVMHFGCDRLPDGKAALDVDVLPQVQLPELAPNQNIQGYTAQELAPGLTAPQVFAFLIAVYEVLRMKSALHFASSAGVTAV